MLELSVENLSEIAEYCRLNVQALADTFRQCFDLPVSIQLEELRSFEYEVPLDQLTSPGLTVVLQCGSTSLLVAIPETIGLPAWLSAPNDSQASRLQTLPVEWSLSILPIEMPLDPPQTTVTAVDDLKAAIAAAAPLRGAGAIPWKVRPAGRPDAPPTTFWMIWPVTAGTAIPAAAPRPAAAAAPAKPAAAAAPRPRPAAAASLSPTPAVPEDPVQRNRNTHLLKLRVPIIVKLAEKRITLGQVVTLAPGSLVPFEKSCEDLLDLCINNQVYCRGEAVKIGEKFGLKINEFVGRDAQRRGPG